MAVNEDKSAAEIDELLGVLRKHAVSEFSQDQFGLRVKFEQWTAQTHMAIADEQAKFEADFAKAAARTEPEGPDTSVVDAQPLDVEAALWGCK